MSRFNYEELGRLIMTYGIEEGIQQFFGESEEDFAFNVLDLKRDIFSSAEVLGQLIKASIHQYLACYGLEDKTEDVFQPIIDLTPLHD